MAAGGHEYGHDDNARGTLIDEAGHAFLETRPHQFKEAGLHQGPWVAQLDRIAYALEGLGPLRVAGAMAVEKDGFHFLT